jgi:hypothetical protein
MSCRVVSCRIVQCGERKRGHRRAPCDRPGVRAGPAEPQGARSGGAAPRQGRAAAPTTRLPHCYAQDAHRRAREPHREPHSGYVPSPGSTHRALTVSLSRYRRAGRCKEADGSTLVDCPVTEERDHAKDGLELLTTRLALGTYTHMHHATRTDWPCSRERKDRPVERALDTSQKVRRMLGKGEAWVPALGECTPLGMVRGDVHALHPLDGAFNTRQVCLISCKQDVDV